MNIRRLVSYPFIFILFIPILILAIIGFIGEALVNFSEIGDNINIPKWFTVWSDWINRGDK